MRADAMKLAVMDFITHHWSHHIRNASHPKALPLADWEAERMFVLSDGRAFFVDIAVTYAGLPPDPNESLHTFTVKDDIGSPAAVVRESKLLLRDLSRWREEKNELKTRLQHIIVVRRDDPAAQVLADYRAHTVFTWDGETLAPLRWSGEGPGAL